ncbi:MAG: DUF4124 domain-containing protein [Burkholderiaceae bacterium]|nr:DUF4124 domain-containing protein [Burkholderiaceae bacterium]
MIRHLACLVLLLAGFAGAADAQYQWRDERGRMNFSDRPPPAGTPADRILRSPKPLAGPAEAGAARTDAAPSTAADAVSSSPAQTPAQAMGGPGSAEPARAAPSYKDKAMAFERRRQERAEEEAKAAQAARESADKARYCGELEAQRRSLASGGRIVTVGADGERRHLDDEARKARLDENARALAASCKS